MKAHFGTISVPYYSGGINDTEERPRPKLDMTPNHPFEESPWDAEECHTCARFESEHPLGRKA